MWDTHNSKRLLRATLHGNLANYRPDGASSNIRTEGTGSGVKMNTLSDPKCNWIEMYGENVRFLSLSIFESFYSEKVNINPRPCTPILITRTCRARLDATPARFETKGHRG